jgi:CRISPR-associated protein Cmr3
MSYQDYFINVFDVLSPRGNQNFGQAGEHASAQLLPWPSVVAGSVRSSVLAANGHNHGDSIKALVNSQDTLARSLALPGTEPSANAFQVGKFCLAEQGSDDKSTASPLIPVPGDVVVTSDGKTTRINRIKPAALPTGIENGSTSPALPILRQCKPAKAMQGWFLNATGWGRYVTGDNIPEDCLVESSEVAARRHCTGIGMDASARRVIDGQLYTAERIEFKQTTDRRVGYVARIHNSADLIDDNVLLRLGGDGHGASMHQTHLAWPDPPIQAIAKHRRFALVLLSPGLFSNGFGPTELNDNQWLGKNISATLQASTTGRSETISGWDLLKNQPKPARRFVPAGAVYWFDNLTGDPEALLAEFPQGSWPDPIAASEQRLIEGFNQVQIVAWHGDNR